MAGACVVVHHDAGKLERPHPTDVEFDEAVRDLRKYVGADLQLIQVGRQRGDEHLRAT